MGTRNLTMVQLDNEIKIAQYGQWDGYPTGVGQDCVKFIKDKLSLLEDQIKFKSELNKLRKATEEEIKILEDSEDFKLIAPWLSRNVGSEILDLIFDGKVHYLCGNSNSFNFGFDSLFCEWAWFLNLDNKTLEVYKGFNKEKLSENDRFFKEDPDEEYYGCNLIKTYPFSNLTLDTMSELEKEAYADED